MPDTIERKTTPDAVGSPQTIESPSHHLVIVQRGQEELIETLRHELAIRNREISRLHDVIASQALALQHPTQALAPSTSKQAHQEPRDSAPSLSVEPAPAAKASLGTWSRFLGWVKGSSAD